LLTHGRWFSPGTPASSTTKTGRHDIAEILLKVALKHQKSNQINQICKFHINSNHRISIFHAILLCLINSVVMGKKVIL
jgi:hypothetical protein